MWFSKLKSITETNVINNKTNLKLGTRLFETDGLISYVMHLLLKGLTNLKKRNNSKILRIIWGRCSFNLVQTIFKLPFPLNITKLVHLFFPKQSKELKIIFTLLSVTNWDTLTKFLVILGTYNTLLRDRSCNFALPIWLLPSLLPFATIRDFLSL